MSDLIILPGDKLHIITRRFFSDDLRRHFAGEVICAAGGLCEVKGYTYFFNAGSNKYRKKPEIRIRIISIADALYVVNKLPVEVDLEDLEYRTVDGRLVFTDRKGFALDINEFGLTA